MHREWFEVSEICGDVWSGPALRVGEVGSISNWNVVTGSPVREQNDRDERDSINGVIWQEYRRTCQRILGTVNSLNYSDIIGGESSRRWSTFEPVRLSSEIGFLTGKTVCDAIYNQGLVVITEEKSAFFTGDLYFYHCHPLLIRVHRCCTQPAALF